MRWSTLLTLALAVSSGEVVRFHCSQVVTWRLDPLVSPGLLPSSHTAVLYFRAQNGSYKLVPQLGNNQFEKANGGLMKSKVTLFQPQKLKRGFRMFIAGITARTLASASKFRQLTYTCMDTWTTRAPEMTLFPTRKCKKGILTSLRFSTFMFGVVWDTKPFNELEWPKNGSNPFVGSFGDATGAVDYADYVFGWKGNALQRILDTQTYMNDTVLRCNRLIA
ncbi:hypothetical protein BDZ45DRAFT_707954 [Acephala macrosclerotiorum]|nr:hypothetical protein BDZ45DRAFT_707954 [Acephala macrosclerotiorum]